MTLEMRDIDMRAEGMERGLERGLLGQVYLMKKMNVSAEAAYRLIVELPDYQTVTLEQIETLYRDASL